MIDPGIINGEIADGPQNLQIHGTQVIRQSSPIIPLWLVEEYPGPRIALFALDQKPIDVIGVAEGTVV